MPAETEDRLRSLLASSRTNIILEFRIRRDLGRVRLDAVSCNASRAKALLCCLWALMTGRPKFGITIFIRDVWRR